MITDKEIKNQGWILTNGVFGKNNLLLKKESGNVIHIIRKHGNYPTIFKDVVETVDEFINITKGL